MASKKLANTRKPNGKTNATNASRGTQKPLLPKKAPLGKGIGVLLQGSGHGEAVDVIQSKEFVRELDIHQIVPNKAQPRHHFDEERLNELAESIKHYGVIQPILVTKEAEDRYRIVAGERRWRAAQLAKLKKIPVIIREMEEGAVLEQALIENIQREDLLILEEAYAYETLMKERGWTQEQLSEKLGKSRSTVTNILRILKLSDHVKAYLNQGVLSLGHAKSILALPDTDQQEALADLIVAQGLSVRQTEARVKQLLSGKEGKEKPQLSLSPAIRLNLKDLELRLSKLMGMKVRLKDQNGQGRIEIPYKSMEEFEQILEILDPGVFSHEANL